jgi:hypothetical protein
LRSDRFVTFGAEDVVQESLKLFRHRLIALFRLFDPLFESDDQFDLVQNFHLCTPSRKVAVKKFKQAVFHTGRKDGLGEIGYNGAKNSSGADMFQKYAPLVFVILFALFVIWMIYGMESAVPDVGL